MLRVAEVVFVVALLLVATVALVDKPVVVLLAASLEATPEVVIPVEVTVLATRLVLFVVVVVVVVVASDVVTEEDTVVTDVFAGVTDSVVELDMVVALLEVDTGVAMVDTVLVLGATLPAAVRFAELDVSVVDVSDVMAKEVLRVVEDGIDVDSAELSVPEVEL